jgi:DNA-binding HxlR family transcriptional regulator
VGQHDEIMQAIRDLEARVGALEQESPRRSGRRPEADLGLIDALAPLDVPSDEGGGPSGTVTYAGVVDHGGETLAWQMAHPVQDLLALDENVVARQLAAVASPVRVRILRELADGPLQTHELQTRLDEPSAGQLYHHLRELVATGLVVQPRRSVYELPPRAVVPLLVLVGCARDLSAGDTFEATR